MRCFEWLDRPFLTAVLAGVPILVRFDKCWRCRVFLYFEYLYYYSNNGLSP